MRRVFLFCLLLSFVIMPAVAQDSALIAVNQVGYFSAGPKIAVYAGGTESETVTFSVHDAATGEAVFTSTSTPAYYDDASGDTAAQLDFSTVSAGEYYLRVGDTQSATFAIGDGLYDALTIDALRYFYLSRSGIALEAAYAGDAYAREGGHLTDGDVACFSGRDAAGREWPGCDYRLDGSGGWYDAGDFGKYVVNAGISVWSLLDAYQRAPEVAPDSSLNIPESGNGTPDILDEARWEIDWMLRMQVPEGQPQAGLVHHKLHGLVWGGIPQLPPPDFDVNDPRRGRYLMPVSTPATLNLAAVAARCAVIWRDIDAAFADRCLTAAESAYQAALANPDLLHDEYIIGNGGGAYGDNDATDEFFWAAAELYAATGEQTYLDDITASSEYTDADAYLYGGQDSLYWADMTLLALSTLATSPNVPADVQATAQGHLVAVADRYRNEQYRQAYHVPMPDYYWGSNSNALNNAIVMAYAYDLTGDIEYRAGAAQAMDYVLGANALNFSFVSGYGTHSLQHPHHSIWTGRDGFPPVPAGVLAGGPNAYPSDDAANIPAILALPRAKRYIDQLESYSTNEVAINWNASLVWLAVWLDSRF